jgi:two-component system NtrC family sensor kinase
MESLASVLRVHSAAIARAAADQLDLDDLAAPLQAFIERIAESSEGTEAIQPQFPPKPGLTDALIARLLRAAEVHSIAVLNRECPRGQIAPYVISLRERFRKSVPKVSVNEEDAQFLRAMSCSHDKSADTSQRGLAMFVRSMMASLRDVVFVHDVHGHLLYVNEAGYTLTGFTPSDLAHGMSIFDLIVPEHVDVVKMRLETPRVTQRAPFTVEIFSREGNRIPLEMTTQTMTEGAGKMLVLGIGRPAILERQLENQIRRTYEYIERVINNAPIGIITTNPDGTIREANPAALSLFGAPSRADLVGHAIYSLRQHEDPVAKARFDELVSRAKNVHSRYFGRTRFGVTLNCDVILVPMKNHEDHVEGILILMVDLSEQVILEHTLHQRERLSALGTIVAGVAHELNNPLTAILGFSQLLLTQNLPDAVKSRINRIVEEASRCEHIVENLMGFSRQVGVEKEMQNINELLVQTVALREYQLRVDGVETVLDLSPDLPATLVAPHSLQSVFLNIINNAQQAMDDLTGVDHVLSISTFIEDGYICVKFSDTGPGIPAENQARIFDPFFTTKQPGEGTGLGLSVAYGIVRDHGGDLHLHNAPGKGATFVVSLPVKVAEDKEDEG